MRNCWIFIGAFLLSLVVKQRIGTSTCQRKPMSQDLFDFIYISLENINLDGCRSIYVYRNKYLASMTKMIELICL